MNTTEPRPPVTHDLKCHPAPFSAILSGTKPFEWRVFDRDYRVGDILNLKEWDPEKEDYTGIICARRVTYLISGGFGIPEGFCIMGITNAIPTPTTAAQGGKASAGGLDLEAEITKINHRTLSDAPDKMWLAEAHIVMEKMVKEILRLRSIPAPLAPQGGDTREAMHDALEAAIVEIPGWTPSSSEIANAILDKFPNLSLGNPQALTWTKEKPKVEGWYWSVVPVKNAMPPQIVLIEESREGLMAYATSERSGLLERTNPRTEWAGPIPQPGSNTPKGPV